MTRYEQEILATKRIRVSVNQDLYPNFCNLNISYGSKVMAKVKFFFFFKSRTKVKVKFLLRTAMYATRNRIYTNRTKKLRLKKICGCMGVCHRTESDLFIFVLLQIYKKVQKSKVMLSCM